MQHCYSEHPDIHQPEAFVPVYFWPKNFKFAEQAIFSRQHQHSISVRMNFQYSEDFAVKLDEQDELASYRNQFLFPQHNGQDMLYFTGNSLGLQPKGVKEALMQECDDWQKFGVEGHFHAKNPWFSYHELFAEGAADFGRSEEA
jgi:hypothetical protein